MNTLRFLFIILGLVLVLDSEAFGAIKITFSNDGPPALLDYFGGREVYLEGDIEPGDAARVRKAFNANAFDTGMVNLNSKGGSVLEAIEIGRIIRKLGLDTYLGKSERWTNPVCFSACTLLYTGGRFRYFKQGASFGVHRFHSIIRDSNGADHAQIIDGMVVSYLAEMGIKSEMLELASKTSPQEIQLLSEEKLKALWIVNNGALPPLWTIETNDGVNYMRGMQEKRTGSGKVTFNCLRNGELFFTGYFGPIKNWEEIKETSGSQSIIIDSVHHDLGKMDILAMNRMLMSFYRLPKKLSDKVKAANSSIGWALNSTSVRGTFRGITVDLDSEGLTKFRSFLKSCHPTK